MDVTEDLRGLRHILGATIACVKFAVAVLGAGEGPHRHGARAGSSNLGFDVRKAHSTLLDKVRIRAVMGNDDFSLASQGVPGPFGKRTFLWWFRQHFLVT